MAVNSTYTQTTGPSNDKPTNFASGRITMPADAITAADYIVQQLGFVPRYIRFWNVTDRISIEWFDGMAADTCLKTAAAGTQTLETTNKGIAVCRSDGTADSAGRYFSVSQNATLAVVVASKVLNWVAFG
jgi:hypothetical protein